MRIGLDALAVTERNLTGMGSYALNLTRALLALETEHRFVVYCLGKVPEILEMFSDRVIFRVCCWTRNRKLAEQLWLPRAIRHDGLDVLHCVCSLPLLTPRCTTVLTVHGLSWRIIPEVFTTPQRLYWQWFAERSMSRATRLLAISGWTRTKIGELLRIPADRIDVVHHGVDQSGFYVVEDEAVISQMRGRYGLPACYVLFVGSTLPVKNLPVLIRAFGRLVMGGGHEGLGLVLAGIKGWGYDEAVRAITDAGLQDRVHFTGRFPAADLTTLYSGASVFVLPSIYEGFGMPLVEAFACGVPVISSNASCLPEVAGEAALLFDPTDERALTDAMSRLLGEPDLRNTMIEKGHARAAAFDWETTARQTLAVYERAVGCAEPNDGATAPPQGARR